jgi:hypothetical protein
VQEHHRRVPEAEPSHAAERGALVADYGSTVRISEERVDPAEVASIVAEAAATRNGWKVVTATPKAVLAQLGAGPHRRAHDGNGVYGAAVA